MLRCAALLLDLDGTLIDSDPASEAIWGRWAAEKGVAIDEILAIHHGRRPEETIGIVAPHLDARLEADRIQTENAAAIEGVRPYPGVAELLALLPLERHAIVTSAKRAVAFNRLTALGLWRDPALVAAEDVRRGKPDPECFAKAARELGFDPAHCVAIEDAPAGVEAAKAAGMTVIALLTTHAAERLPADRHVDHIGALRITIDGEALRID